MLCIKGNLERESGFSLKVDLSLPDQGLTAIVGSSGSGKSTLLRCLAGLEKSNPFSIDFRGQPWHTLAPHLRPLSFVFQEPRLFPHLTVEENLLFGRNSSTHQPRDLDYFVDKLAIRNLLTAFPTKLSGGQRQRVALARALIRPADLLLLDEPLAALDQKAREEIAPFIKTYCTTHNTPALYVSHNMDEVLQIADHLVLIDEGRVQASGPANELANLLVGNLQNNNSQHETEVGSILEGKIIEFDQQTGLTELSLHTQRLFVPGDHSKETRALRLYVPAKDVTIALGEIPQTSVLNQLQATINTIHQQDNFAVMLELNIEGHTLLAQVTKRSCQLLQLKPGMPVHALVKAISVKA